MDDAGFIFACWGITLGAVGTYALYMVRKARRAGRDVKAEDLPWT